MKVLPATGNVGVPFFRQGHAELVEVCPITLMLFFSRRSNLRRCPVRGTCAMCAQCYNARRLTCAIFMPEPAHTEFLTTSCSCREKPLRGIFHVHADEKVIPIALESPRPYVPSFFFLCGKCPPGADCPGKCRAPLALVPCLRIARPDIGAAGTMPACRARDRMSRKRLPRMLFALAVYEDDITHAAVYALYRAAAQECVCGVFSDVCHDCSSTNYFTE